MQATKDNITYVRLDDQAEEIVNGAMQKNSLDKSSAIRMIIREWAAMKAGMVTIPKIGIIKDGDKAVIDPKYWQTEEGIEQSR
ncbi:hypothetical protein KJ564_08760 [bacterium]|nr:hypothetical protein [bacterium]